MVDLLPFFLEESGTSLEFAESLHGCTFTTMTRKFPRRRRLANKAIAKYTLRVKSDAGNPYNFGRATEAFSCRGKVYLNLSPFQEMDNTIYPSSLIRQDVEAD